jgi:transcriptional regulator
MFHYIQYRSTDVASIRKLVDRFPLALITTHLAGRWHASHVPLFLSDDSTALLGHVDAANLQFALQEPLDTQVVFSGPDCYVPPEAYVSKQLPTWNYLRVHAQGSLHVTSDPMRNLALIRMAAERLSGAPSAFRVSDADERIARWIGGVRGIRIEIAEIEGRFKLSQDKPAEDVVAAAHYLAQKSCEEVSADWLLSFCRAPATLERATLHTS